MTLALALLLVASGSIGGHATSSGKPLANVTVTATTPSMPKPFTATTAANGAYDFPALPAGTYDVTFSLAGHQTLTRRAEVRNFERSRIDAELEVSEEGESVTQTSEQQDVHERPQAAWTLDRAIAEALPIGRSVAARVDLAPGRVGGGEELPGEAIEDVSAAFAGLSAELGHPLVDVTTRRVGHDLQAAVRDTFERYRGDDVQRQEASVGGLWMFAAGEHVDGDTLGFAKGTFAPTAHDTVALETGDVTRGSWLHVSPRWTALAEGTRDSAALRGYTFVGGAHELAAGIEEHAGYFRDRWNLSDRAVVEGGLRYEDDELLPRLGFVFGSQTRIIATYARYADSVDEGAIGVAHQVMSSGYARAMLIRREDRNIATLDGALRWLLFTFGTTATFESGATAASAWMLIDPPIPGHKLNIAVLERYRFKTPLTDVAVNYAWPHERITPFAELETQNVFREDRVWRLGLGLRLGD